MDASSDIRIRAVNKELYQLLVRCKAILAICGGEVPKGLDRKEAGEFNYRRSMLIAHLEQLDGLVEARDNGGMAHDSRDYIRTKLTIETELDDVSKELDELSGVHKAEMSARGSARPSPAEIEARKAVIEAIVKEFRAVFRKIRGYAHSGDATDDHSTSEMGAHRAADVCTLSMDQVLAGNLGGAVQVHAMPEQLTAEHQQQLQQIRGEKNVQGEVLDEISAGLDALKEMASSIHDEILLQEKMVTDLDTKVDKTQTTLDRVNERAQDALKHLKDRSSNCCMYMICLAILAGLGMVIYNFAKKK